MDGFVPKRPGVQHDIFDTQDIVITDREEPKLFVGKPATRQAQVDAPPPAVYDSNLVNNVVRAYINWGG